MARRSRGTRGVIVLLGVMLLLALIAVVAVALLYRHYVVKNPGEHISREYILRRISQESPVYYRDGKSRIGVFFGDEHRQYLKFDDLPTDYVNAIVAAEDKRYWDHPGFDVLGFSRAMLLNLKSRQLVAGGSTITSQTAKNLYDRKDRTLGPKLKEVLDAFRLEAHYSKEEILEFYANQFHVYGNGRGLGIAARYFFDKDVRELDTLECAFLAGIVKAPFRYNPFVGNTQEARDAARRKAEARTDYVLSRMAEDGYLKPAAAADLKAREIPFRRGQWQYEQNVILDYVYERLREEPFVSLFEQAGIDDPATAGLHIVTTVDQAWQEAAIYGLRHNLTEVGTQLEGLTLEAFVSQPTQELRPIREDEILLHRFFDARVLEVRKEGALSLLLDLGGPRALVDEQGLIRVADFLKKAREKAIWATAGRKDAAAMLEGFAPGQKVTVSIREPGHGDELPRADLEATTTLQGAVVVLEEGEIRAMVGGADNRNFNRATSARRQLGSTWKTLTWAAAISLGWSPLDPVDNTRQGFAFGTEPFYWPRADHAPKSDHPSMAWSAATSENLATVSLLYHMTDRLTEEQRMDLAARVDMAPRPSEPAGAFLARVRDTWGILPTEEGLKEGVFQEVRDQALPDLVFSGLVSSETDPIRWLPYGRGFEEEAARVKKARDLAPDEKAVRLAWLDKSFLSLEQRAPRALEIARRYLEGQGGPEGLYVVDRDGQRWIAWTAGAPQPGWTAVISPDQIRNVLAAGGAAAPAPAVEEAPPADPEDSAFSDPEQGGQGSAEREDEGPRALRRKLRTERMKLAGEGTPAPDAGKEARRAAVARLMARVEEAMASGSHTLEERLLVDGLVTPAVLTRIRENIEVRAAELSSLERYDLRRLVRDRDFRLLMGMNYTLAMARQAGVTSPMKPVLSLPLGSNDITLLESALIYQTFINGRVYSFLDAPPDADAPPVGAAILSYILNPDGSVLWRATPSSHQILDPRQAAAVGRLLRGVVERGTGRTAEGAVAVVSPDPARQKEIAGLQAAIPLMGKTGTTNDYVNVAFVGYLPTLPAGYRTPAQELPYGSALTVAAYVGYDDNKPMKRGAIRITGALGALPVWIDTARGICRDIDYSRVIDLADLAFGGEKTVPLRWPDGMEPVLVSQADGLRLGEPAPSLPPEVPPEGVDPGGAPPAGAAPAQEGGGAVAPPADAGLPQVRPPPPEGAVYYDVVLVGGAGEAAGGYAPFTALGAPPPSASGP